MRRYLRQLGPFVVILESALVISWTFLGNQDRAEHWLLMLFVTSSFLLTHSE